MIVADSNTQINPAPLAPASIASTLQSIDDMAAQLKHLVTSAGQHGEAFDAVERKVKQSVLEIGFQAMELFVQLQGQGDLGPEVTTGEQQVLHRSNAPVKTTIRSIFGAHNFSQFTYSPGANKAIQLRPISARMSLPAERWSYLLQEISQMLAVESSYEQATRNLGTILGSKFSVDTAERINAELGQAAGEFLADSPRRNAGRLLRHG